MDNPLERLGRALGRRGLELNIEFSRLNTQGTAMLILGSTRGLRFFAKVMMEDWFELACPQVVPEVSPRMQRTAGQQVAIERDAAENFGNLEDGVTVPELVVCSESLGVIVWQAASGRPFNSQFIRDCRVGDRLDKALESLTAVGRWLRKVHDRTTSGAVSHDLAYWKETHERTGALALIHQLELESGRTIPDRMVSIHGDLSLPNILLDDESDTTWVIDFEHSRSGASIHDLALIPANLRVKLLNPMIPKRSLHALEAAFWSGYGWVPEALRMYATVAANVSALYTSRPRWTNAGSAARFVAPAVLSIMRAWRGREIMRTSQEEATST